MTSVVGHLIRKDYRLYRYVIVICLLGGVAALAILQIGGETAFLLGSVGFFLALVFCASLMPSLTIINERKKQTLPFLMSLPVSPIQYTTAKLIANVGMFLLCWCLMMGGLFSLVFMRHALPGGGIPSILIYSLLPFVGFSVIVALAMVGESEFWGTIGIAAVNSTYWFWWYVFSTHVPELNSDWKSPVIIWRPEALRIIGAEIAAIVLILGLTYYLQSRKRDFV